MERDGSAAMSAAEAEDADHADDGSLVLARLAPVADTARASFEARVLRVRRAWRAILQTAVAGGVAWSLARWIVGAPEPFFAPAAAVISLGLARGQPTRRAVEVTIGVAIGIGVAEVLRGLIGLGPVQIGAIVALTIVVALFVGAGQVLINQAAISAVLVMTLPSTGSGVAPDRFYDAMIGGAVALLTSQLVFASHPTDVLAGVVRRTLDELASALREGSQALAGGTLELAQMGLRRLRSLDAQIAQLFEALAQAEEAASLSPSRRRARGVLEPYGEAARQVDYAVRNSRVLLRGVAAALRTHVAVPPELAQALETLAQATDALAAQLIESADVAHTRRLAIAAAEQATAVLADHHDLRNTVIIGQVRATAVDLLRASGLDAGTARAQIPLAPSDDM
jgi:uncharacterized membrane protein YgaE (UPF0421/DUF939 family)